MKTIKCVDILLPKVAEPEKWAVVSCDQFTSQRDYWKTLEGFVGDAPSTLKLIFPEVYLEDSERRVPLINEKMKEYLSSVLVKNPDAMIFVERTQPSGGIRRGIIGAVDLEAYDYKKGSDSLIRATEGTVLERIPPRVAVRRNADVELPHVMLLIDDPEKTVIEPLIGRDLPSAYDFDLMLGGGHICGKFIENDEQARIFDALEALAGEERTASRYGAGLAPLLFAVGDGNHSLATAKASYEEIKAKIGEDAAKSHPARYALAEVVNLHDDALVFEPIYRVVFGVDVEEFKESLKSYVSSLCGGASEQEMLLVWEMMLASILGTSELT